MPEVGSSAVLSPMNRDVNQRQSSTQLYGLFGLGGPEIAIIGIAAAFLLGPEKLAEFGMCCCQYSYNMMYERIYFSSCSFLTTSFTF